METNGTPAPKYEFLVEEYKLCHDYATHMDSIAWQMAAILFPVSLASLAYLFSLSGPRNVLGLVVIVIISAISVTVLWIWLELFKRWLAYQQIAYHRMAEIEKKLGLWLITYGQILRGSGELDSQIRQESEDDEHYRRLLSRFKQFPRRKTEALITLLIRVLIVGWGLLVFAQLARMIFNI